jgi:hypothetical protein
MLLKCIAVVSLVANLFKVIQVKIMTRNHLKQLTHLYKMFIFIDSFNRRHVNQNETA